MRLIPGRERLIAGVQYSRMAMGVVEAAVLALAVLFYAVTIYHVTLIFIGLRLTADRGKPFDKGSLRNPVDLPKVSILIPAKDEEVVIEGAILCANRLDYPKDLLEIIVVEDGSKDETPTIGKRMASLVPNVVCVSGGESKGKPAALNRAFANATGDLIAIFDSDTRYGPDLLLRAVKHLHDHPEIDVAQAFPQVMNAETNVITRINYYETRFWFQGLQSAKDRYGLFMHLAGTGMFIRRRALQALGPWDESCLTEDLDYSLRLARSGGKVGMVDADIWIQPTYRARHLVRQRQRWWGGALQVFWKGLRGRRSGATRLRQRIDTFIYIASPILFLISSILFLSSIVLYGLYGGAMASLMAWIYGIIGTNLILTPLIVGEAVTTRRKKLLWLIPGLYFYWFLQLASFVSIAFRLVFWPKGVAWQRTPKMRVD